MSETLTERIKYIAWVSPDHLMSAFASDFNEIVNRAEAAEARAAQLEAERDTALEQLRLEKIESQSAWNSETQWKAAANRIADERDAAINDLTAVQAHYTSIMMALYVIDRDVFGPLTTKEGIAELLRQRDEARCQLEQAQTNIAELRAECERLAGKVNTMLADVAHDLREAQS